MHIITKCEHHTTGKFILVPNINYYNHSHATLCFISFGAGGGVSRGELLYFSQDTRCLVLTLMWASHHPHTMMTRQTTFEGIYENTSEHFDVTGPTLGETEVCKQIFWYFLHSRYQYW